MATHSTNTRQKGQGARLGQHFLTRPEIAGWVAEAADLTQDDTVLEIGPGHGILTRELLSRAGKVIAVEKDPVLIAELQSTFTNEIAAQRLILAEQDIRDFDPLHSQLATTNYKLVANIPYYITGLIIRQFLETTLQPTSMVLLVQKEVAERIVAKKTKPLDSARGKESLLSMSVKAYGTPTYVRTVKAGSFSPPPKVDSAILKIAGISRKRYLNSTAEQRFFEVLHAGFANKRKTIGGNLCECISKERLAELGISPSTRAEALTTDEWCKVADA